MTTNGLRAREAIWTWLTISGPTFIKHTLPAQLKRHSTPLTSDRFASWTKAE